MDPADRNAIEGLFSRLAAVERRAGARDPQAEALIADELRHLPSAPYYLAQTVLVQEHVLTVAERRIRELESELERRPQGDFLGGLFGGGRDLERGDIGRTEQRTPGPWDRDNRGGGFLAGAAQTALGVTGGILLGSAIAGMFGAGAATAAEPASAPVDETPQDDGFAEDAGAGDFGDGGGGFDFGGDF